jgi:aminoglycoside phosphotransferase (APT) family kinase protein
MAKRSADQIRRKTEMAKKIFRHHFGKLPVSIAYKPAGLTNYVFEAKGAAGKFIIRLAEAEPKLQDYIKEQWVVARARENGVPVANILEVGAAVVGKPYMLQEKMEGQEAADHPDRLKILRDLGSLAKLIHAIHTTGFGKVFDWSENQLSKNTTWKAFLEEEMELDSRLEIFEKAKVFSAVQLKRLRQQLNKIGKWQIKPGLNHGDLRLKNVIINDTAKIIGIIDWEHASSNFAPFWDFSIALHDLSIDAKQHFLEGYGMAPDEFERSAFAVKAFNIINYAPKIKRLSDRRDSLALEYYRLRLNGFLDLYSI